MSFQTCMSFFLCWTEDDILNNAGNQTVDGPIDFHSKPISFPTMKVNGDKQLFGSSKYLLLCATKVWNDVRVSKWWQHFNLILKYIKIENSCFEL